MEQWNRQIKTARYMLLGTVIITVVNMAFLLGNVDMFISYCAALPYYLLFLGKLFDNGYMLGAVNGEFTATGLLMGGAVLAVYLVVWWLARSNRRWLQISLWLIVADLLVLIGLAIAVFSNPLDCFWEAVIHIAVIWEIRQGLRAQKKRDAALAKAREEAALQEQLRAASEEAPQEEQQEESLEAPVP